MEPRLKLHVIASGSKGNCSIVEDARTGECLVIDCGITKKAFMAGAAEAGVDLSLLKGILVTHDHTDHTKGLGVVLRGLLRMGITPPVFAEDAVCRFSSDIRNLERDHCFEPLGLDRSLSLGSFGVHAFSTSHDAASSCGFRVEAGDDALGYMTDTGFVTPQAHQALREVRILALESNHDAEMLRTCDYPSFVKLRIAGERGHLSNDQGSQELESLLWSGLEQVVAMHVSENSNTYELPARHFQEVVQGCGNDAQVSVALQNSGISVG